MWSSDVFCFRCEVGQIVCLSWSFFKKKFGNSSVNTSSSFYVRQTLLPTGGHGNRLNTCLNGFHWKRIKSKMYFTPFKRVIMMYIVKQSSSGVAYLSRFKWDWTEMLFCHCANLNINIILYIKIYLLTDCVVRRLRI